MAVLRRRKARKAVNTGIAEHIHVLARKREQLVWEDEYGLIHPETWEKEKQYFILNVLGGAIPGLAGEDFPLSGQKIDALIEHHIDKLLRKGPADGYITGYRGESRGEHDRQTYRQYCIRLLSLGGWTLERTREDASRQGPIIAERQGRLLVLTLVKDGSPVGKGLVQRTFELKHRHGADLAAVVSNAGFTRWARMASCVYGVMLLSHEDLMNIE